MICVVTDLKVSARPDALEDCVERLAKKAAAVPHERRMALVWSNHASFSEPRAERLRSAFAARMEAAQVKWVQGEAAPALRVAMEETPTQIVFTASVPAEGGTSVVIEAVARGLAGVDEGGGSRVRLEKQLVWQQQKRILSAALLQIPGASEKRLALLTEEALLVYRGEAGNWNQEASKTLSGPRPAARSAFGQLLVSEEPKESVTILLPGRRCQASVTDDSAVTCASAGVEWPAGRLMAVPRCGTQTWWLKSDAGDFASTDRLLLENSGAAKDAPTVAEVGIAGPVISIGAGESVATAAVVARNLSSGNYEVYRVAAVCED